MIYVSEEETAKAGKSPPARDSRQGSIPRDLGVECGSVGPGGLAQLFASSIHWWEVWVALLVPSQPGPQHLPVGQDQDKMCE